MGDQNIKYNIVVHQHGHVKKITEIAIMTLNAKEIWFVEKTIAEDPLPGNGLIVVWLLVSRLVVFPLNIRDKYNNKVDYNVYFASDPMDNGKK